MRKTEVNKIAVGHLYIVLSMLVRFSDGFPHISYDLRLVFGRFKTVFDNFAMNEIKLKLRTLFYWPATKTVLNRE